ncbi:hypothetical protein A5787_07705 [Mycobacterium sp. 852002-50816_SCH5313054-b]|uniref:PE family protein n=1 Tax=Mycobacterium sp. 852002-50816_SCH5313054-b TaxID=1834092 RepID=UPI0007FE8DCA|nr:PE family protein [Mycobacterium sp. 852002-50816_SCH5313054-b]OBF51002.1 hypothetical protein A5787_07705 [Mycobacterium sp. 852002-50816_SCH5313054-b]
MSFVTVAPDMAQQAAQDLADIRALMVEAASKASAPTTAVVPAAADEVSAAISAMFGDFGQKFQWANAQAQAFHAEFVKLINAGAAAYASTELANAEQAVANAINAPTETVLGSPFVPGGVAVAAQSAGATGLLGGLLGGGTSGGSLLGGLAGAGTGLGGLLGGLTGGTGLLGGLGSLGGVVGSLGNLGSLGGVLGSLVTSALPGLPTTLGGLTNTLTGVVNPLLPGMLNMQAGAGPFFSGIAGPYDALVYNTWTNLNSLAGGWLADPFPFLRQFVANQMGYGQTIATALQTGNFQPVSAIPGEIVQHFANVVGTLTNTSVTSSLVVQQVLPTPVLALDNVVGLPLVFGASLLGPPAATMEAAGYAASLFASAVQAGDGAAAFAALVDAPAYIVDGFLNGQATFPYALNLSSLTGPAVADLLNVTVVANFPLDGLLHPPGYYPVTATVTALGGSVLPPVAINLGVGSTPFSGLLPFLVNYVPQQLAQAIGAPASPPPLISIPLFTF